ncbi:MAG TPA: AAA family ATPase, partial [Gemmatimonadales bacterium]|nr:AAA family ATPase [Gemmatimonadales bacterium]
MTPAESADVIPFRLTCLGPPELAGPDGDQIQLRTRKHLALLIFLAIEPFGRQRRDWLASLLWPATNINEARHSLATALSVLRQTLGVESVTTSQDTLQLTPGYVVTDVAALLARDEFELESIAAAVFLDGFEIPDAPDFSHWIDTQRTRLQPHLHVHFDWRIEQCRRTGNMRAMSACAEELLRIDPLSEVAMRAAIEVRAMVNDRTGALRMYEDWKERFRQELGGVPSREIEQLADRLRRRASAGGSSIRLAPVPTEQWQERCFVGRGAEFQTCYDRWIEARNGAPGHVLLIGESGIGKSTIAGRVATAAALEGASVARVQCHELERELPFGVACHLITRLVDLPGAGATPPMQLAELARLVAVVRQRWPGLPEPPEYRGEEARLQFTEALLGLVGAVADEHPLVIVLDDVHLSDITSLAVLHLMLRRLEAVPVVAMLTMPGSGEGIPDQAWRFARPDSMLPMSMLPVSPLPEAHQLELLDELLRGRDDPGPTVRRALMAGSRGNPMVLELLVGDWLRHGHQSMALSGGSMSDRLGGVTGPDLRGLIAQALGSLDPEARAVADLG